MEKKQSKKTGKHEKREREYELRIFAKLKEEQDEKQKPNNENNQGNR